jgi:hypothetical protein
MEFWKNKMDVIQNILHLYFHVFSFGERVFENLKMPRYKSSTTFIWTIKSK